MNEFEPVSSSQIERLVDGELPREERRAVLLALDHERDGWRRLAFAFLESQAIKESLGHRAKATVAPMSIAPAVAHRPAVRSRFSPSAVVAVVASAALMFGLGRLSTSSTELASRDVRETNSVPATYEPPAPGPADNSQNEMLVSDAGAPVLQQQTLRLELGDAQGGAAQVVEVPVVENTGIRPEDLLDGPPVISDSVQRELLRSGKRVYEQRQLYEVTLEDGRRGVMPVSNVFLEDAGWDVYQ